MAMTAGPQEVNFDCRMTSTGRFIFPCKRSWRSQYPSPYNGAKPKEENTSTVKIIRRRQIRGIREEVFITILSSSRLSGPARPPAQDEKSIGYDHGGKCKNAKNDRLAPQVSP